MTKAEQLADYVVRTTFQDISREGVEQLKIRVLDALGCAIGAQDGDPIGMIRAQIEDFGGRGRCTMIGGGKTSPDRAAFYNSALVRYLDYNDSYLAKNETCHPSDNLGAVLAASEYSNAGGKDFLVSLAVAYQVQCRLSDVAPVRAKGFDHTTQGSYAVAAGVSKALGLNREETMNALAICGTGFNALRVTRTGELSHWKGLAYPNTVFGCFNAVFLAMRGITGPKSVFEGNKGFMDSISGQFEIDWEKEDLEIVRGTVLKRYNAEVHSQSTIEGALELKDDFSFKPEDIKRIEIETFDVAFHIIGGGEEGDRKIVRIKEQADHSLPYMVAVALLDGQVMPEQYLPERIVRDDVQSLLQKITIKPSSALSDQFPASMPCRIRIYLKNGTRISKEKRDYEGFHTNPMRWEVVVEKFNALVGPYTKKEVRDEIVRAVLNLESINIKGLVDLLSRLRNRVTAA